MEENKKELFPVQVELMMIFKSLYCLNSKESEKQNEQVFRCGECIFSDNGYCDVNTFISKYGTNEQVKRMNSFIRKD